MAVTLLKAEQHRACKAVLVVHEFRTIKTEDVNLDADATALNSFLRVLLLAKEKEEKGEEREHAAKMPMEMPTTMTSTAMPTGSGTLGPGIGRRVLHVRIAFEKHEGHGCLDEIEKHIRKVPQGGF